MFTEDADIATVSVLYKSDNLPREVRSFVYHCE